MQNPSFNYAMSGPFKVYIGLVPTGYLDSAAITDTILKGVRHCYSLTPASATPRPTAIVRPSVLISPNVIASQQGYLLGYTHPEILNGTLSALFRECGVRKAQISTHKSPYGFDSDRFFAKCAGASDRYQYAGYNTLSRIFSGSGRNTQNTEHAENTVLRPSTVECLKTNPQEEYRYLLSRHQGEIEIAEVEAMSPSKLHVYCPKLRTENGLDGLAGALRLAYPHYHSNRETTYQKLLSKLEASYPQLIVSDGIVVPIGGGQLTQRGQELGVVLIANNAVAHDLVAAKIFHLSLKDLPHLEAAVQAGWGPDTINKIDLASSNGHGMDSLELLGQKTRAWNLGHPHVEDLVDNVEILPTRTAPSMKKSDGLRKYFLDWISMFLDLSAFRDQIHQWPAFSVVVGELDKLPDHSLVFVLGAEAEKAFREVCSSSKLWFQYRGVRFEKTQMKDGRNVRVWFITDQQRRIKRTETLPSFLKLAVVFFIATRFLVSSPLLRLKNIPLFIPQRRKRKKQSTLVASYHLSHNAFWFNP